MRPFLTVTMILCSACVIFLSVGCSSVTTPYPLSDPPKPIDQDKFEGTWLIDDAVFHLKFARNGIAQVAGVEWENDQFQLIHFEMIVTKGETHNFLSVRIQEEGTWLDEYHLLSYTFSDHGDLVIWNPHVDGFKKLLEEKHLQGIVTDGKYSTDISITNAPVRLLEWLNDPEHLTLFNYTEPTILRKISEE